MVESVPPAFRAVEIAMVAIKQNRFTTWAELMASGIGTRLDDAQLALVKAHPTFVDQIQLVAGKPVIVTYCPVCLRMAFFGSGTIPTKCTLSYKCTGKPVKAGAKRAVVADGEDAAVPEALEE